MSTTDVLRAVARIASATHADMCNSVMGRGGNPARRFAMWALFRAGGRTHAEIAGRLQTTQSNVAVTLRRLRSQPSAEIAAWMAAWEDEFE
jgi:DNA-binding MarR family transcriptional regulator